MPTYVHTCPVCNITFDDMRSASVVHVEPPCPQCQKPAPRDWEVEGKSQVPHRPPVEQYSEAAGIAPHQIPRAKAMFPHHEFAPDGRMIFKGQRHKDRVLKDIGMMEYTKRDKLKSGR